MKKMYEDGDDEMKRTIAKAWTEGQDKKNGPPMPMMWIQPYPATLFDIKEIKLYAYMLCYYLTGSFEKSLNYTDV